MTATPFVLLNPVITVNAVDLTGWCKKFAFPITFAELDSTTFATNGWITRVGGLGDSSIAADFNQDFIDNMLDEIIWGIGIARVAVPWTVKPGSGSVSASNPQYSGSVLPSQIQPINNGVGELAVMSLTWPGSGAIARAVS